ncbi:deoxyribonuclease IV [Symmachiella dynata]|uniref:deoxyribonuclease IV n=1 Tax=Symmachiella dynata TaxID=2527995 RepID=UPI0030EC6CFA
MPLLGAHMSIAGGYYKAVRAAAQFDMDCVQIFTKNNNQWRAKPLSEEDIRLFREALEETGITHPVAHDSYLINLASPDDALWKKSLDAFVIELQRAEALGLIGVVMHPGSFVKSSEEEGLEKIVQALDEAHRQTEGFQTQVLLETTAGQGTNLGHRFEQLAYIFDHVEQSERLGVCVDTCHIFAAGYAITEPKDYKKTMKEFDRLIGTDRIRAFHLNDSKKEFGSRVDRHEKIGEGFLGLEPFRNLLNDRRFAKVPMYMETPKGDEDGTPLDEINLATLRSLVKKRKRTKRS